VELKNFKNSKNFPKLIKKFTTSKIFCQTSMGLNVHDVLKKVVVYYTRKNKNVEK
jgi:hypothetical protein